MKYREGAVIGALKRAKSFLADDGAVLAEAHAADFARAQRKVDEVLTRLMTYGVDQDGGSRGAKGETAKQRQLRLDLRNDWLKPIAAIARRQLPQVPEYAALQMPKASRLAHGFCASARGMAAAAEVHREALIGYGLPESFVEDLNRAVDEFEASLSHRESNHNRQVAATKGLEEQTKEARTVLAVLDALVRRWAKDNEPLQRQWESSRLIRRRPGPVSVTEGSATVTGSEAAPPNERPLSIA
jgi:hypothetical protein